MLSINSFITISLGEPPLHLVPLIRFASLTAIIIMIISFIFHRMKQHKRE